MKTFCSSKGSPWILRIIMVFFIQTIIVMGGFIAAGIGSAWGEETVIIESLRINDRLLSEKDGKIALYKQLLPGGKLYVSGKAVSKEGQVVSLEVTRDGGKTWQSVLLGKDGYFEYGFRPKAEGSYAVCVRARDSKGIQNVVEKTCKEITVSEKNIYTLVREVLDEMVEAYENRNGRLFMSFIGDDFYGDKDILDRGLRSSASQYHDVDIRYTLNSVVPDYVDKVFASVTFNRRYTLIRTGKTQTDGGTTAFIFRFEGGHLKVISMTRPLMFFQ
jgi:hypothetical protein